MLDEETEPKAWEQLPGESDAAYARFLIYRNLGPSRSIEIAYKSTHPQKATNSKKKQQISGQWTKESGAFEWVRRANQWDIEMLTENGREVVLLFVKGLQKIVRKAVATLEKDNIEPGDWNSAVAAIHTVGQFVPGEAVQAVQSGTDSSNKRVNADSTA